MQGYDEKAARDYIVKRVDHKAYRALEGRLESIVEAFITYDLHFMRLTGVLDENGEQGENDYDDDEAFEYIYDAWLNDNGEEDDEMLVAALLNDYMELQYAFLKAQGLAEL